jgi:hypothetical protein
VAELAQAESLRKIQIVASRPLSAHVILLILFEKSNIADFFIVYCYASMEILGKTRAAGRAEALSLIA